MHLPPPVHGVTLVNQRIAASAAIAAELELEVVALQFAPSIEALGRISLGKLARAAAIGVRLVQRLALDRPDAVYLTMSPHGGALIRDCGYAALARLARVPRIYHLHARGIPEALGTGWRRRLGAWVFDGAWVIHLGRALVDETAGLADPSRVLVVENGVPDANPSGALAGSGGAVPRVLFLSNMIRDKGPLVLVEALAVLARRGVALEATFAGAAGEPATLEAFDALVDRHGLGDRVRYVGPAFDAAKHALFASHDVFALPTLRDAFPLVVLEAMQFGLPVVTSPIGSIPEIVADGETGLFAPPGDPGALANKLAVLATVPELRRRLGAAGRARYRQQFTFEAFERRLAAALTWIIARHEVALLPVG
jgi:glycosyltransferase involved in cell wall biosynthesis